MLNSSLLNSSQLNSAGTTSLDEVVSDSLTVHEMHSALAYLIVADFVSLDDATLTTLIVSILEDLSLNSSMSSAGNYNLTFTELVEVSEAIAVTFPVIIQNTISASSSFDEVLRKIVAVSDGLRASSQLSSSAVFNRALVSALTIAEALNLNLFAEAVADQLTASDTLSEIYKAFESLVSLVTIDETEGDAIKISVVSSDSVSLDDSQDLNFIYSNTLDEEIAFVITVKSGDNIYQGFSYSPETFSVTEYDNYPFNSLTYTNGNYLMASDNGLFLSGGTLDESEFITARIKTAISDLEISNIKQVPQVYLGIANDASLVLSVSVDGKYSATYELAVDSEDLSTQMFKIGKGLKGRYWQFTLETKGNSQFDLEEIEIFPMTFGRKR